MEAAGVKVDLSNVQYDRLKDLTEQAGMRAKVKKALPTKSDHAGNILLAWMAVHGVHPYPSRVVKCMLSLVCGRTVRRVDQWFRNRRRAIRLATASQAKAPE